MRFQARRPNRSEENILPLTNIVFLLLIFFMLAGRLSAADPFRIDLPVSASQAEASERTIVVAVAADGRLALDGAEVSGPALEAALAERLDADPAARVQLRADSRAEALALVALTERLRAAGVERLLLITVPEAP
ncbi:MAG: biopolymer transporter ExbD [Rhodospirillaceae bacterium]|nr:biopolymer transporter ExbD [Rhodospirillaceae bacterium]MCA8933147.1 biopolymer transporter ExbD [Rhodospirillaceae bacterium]